MELWSLCMRGADSRGVPAAENLRCGFRSRLGGAMVLVDGSQL